MNRSTGDPTNADNQCQYCGEQSDPYLVSCDWCGMAICFDCMRIAFGGPAAYAEVCPRCDPDPNRPSVWGADWDAEEAERLKKAAEWRAQNGKDY